jgi:hypothetical protein
MSGNVKDYDPKQVIATWVPLTPGVGVINLNEGIAEGTFISISREKRSYTKKMGSDGEGTRVRSNDRSGTVTVTIRGGSATNDKLSTVLDIAENTGLGNLGPLAVDDFTGTSLATSPQAYIEGWPDKEYADDESDNDWTFICHNLVLFHGGNKDAA